MIWFTSWPCKYAACSRHGFVMQRAMTLTKAQENNLRGLRARHIEDSELARRRRSELWQQLSCRMMGDDRRSMERMALVRSGFRC